MTWFFDNRSSDPWMIAGATIYALRAVQLYVKQAKTVQASYRGELPLQPGDRHVSNAGVLLGRLLALQPCDSHVRPPLANSSPSRKNVLPFFSLPLPEKFKMAAKRFTM